MGMSFHRFFLRRQWDEERRRELESHIAHEIDDNQARGMTAQEARRQAYIKFGNPTAVREEIWEMNSLVSVEDLGRDLRFAFRQLRHSPGFALIAVLTLALGVGINTAVFSMVNGLMFSSLHIQNESRVLEIAERPGDLPWQPNLSLPEFEAVRDQTKNVFSQVVGDQYGLDGLSMQGTRPDRVFTDYVTAGYFQTLGVQPMLGRLLRPDEGVTPGADPVIVLSYAYWKRHFAADTNIVGRQVSLDGHPLTVVGVAPRSFRGLNTALTVEAWLPVAMIIPIENVPLTDYNKPSNRNIRIYARLQPKASQAEVNAGLSLASRRLASEFPHDEKDFTLHSFPLYAGRNAGFDGNNSVGHAAALFLGLAGLVLLLACVNVANLLLVRATVREREMVIRSALGARRFRLIRQMLTESILLAIFGGASGVGLGIWSSTLLGSVNLQTDMPLSFDFSFDWHVLAFSATVALLAGAVVGIVPAWRLGRANLNLILREGGRGIAGGGHKLRDSLVIVQVASALMLLIVASLFTRSLAQSEHANLGFNPNNVLTLMMDPGEIGYSDAQARDFYRSMLPLMRAVPGIASATVAQTIPMGLIGNSGDSVTLSGFQPSTGQLAPVLSYDVINSDYFLTLGIPILQGRAIADSDSENNLHVVVISESMAEKYWPHQNPLGQQVTMITNDPTRPMTVVGVAKDARYQGFSGPFAPYFYVPFQQHFVGNSLETLEVRTMGDPVAMAPEIERAIHNMTPGLPVFEVKTLHQALYSPNGLLLFQVVAALAGIMGTLGLVLAIVGVYGVLSYVVSQKTGEIGVRMALGANRSDILRMVYKQGLWIVGIGLTVGLALSFGVAHLLRSMIIVSATDPVTYVSVPALLAAIALLACYIPARRAMRTEPMEALRTQ
jgi:predicted permease